MSEYTTKATRTKGGYFCRIFRNGKAILQAKVESRMDIGGAFRDMLRTLDKGGGDAFTSSARYRNGAGDNKLKHVKHEWLPKEQTK